MTDLLFWFGVFVLSLVVLIKAADYFTSFSEKLGLALRIPPFIVGIIIVSVGTSLPELVSSVIAAYNGTTDIVAANVIGSNIFNILATVGIASIITKKIVLERDLINIDLPLLASFSALLIVTCVYWGEFVFVEGIVCLVAFAIYIHYSIVSREREIDKLPKKEKLEFWIIPGIVISSVFVFIGAYFTVEGVIKISEITNIGTSVISLTAVALGTSLPELAVSVRAAMKKKFEIALGNIIGSNIFNGTLVIGTAALVAPLKLSEETLTIGIPFLIVSTLLMVFTGISRRIHNWEGAIFILIYVIFIGKIFNFF